jgi:hypothetical protein
MFSYKYKYNNNYFQSNRGRNFVYVKHLKKKKRLNILRLFSFKKEITADKTSNSSFLSRLNKNFLARVSNKFNRFFLKKHIRTHRRFLKRLNKNFFHFFLKKIGLHKHRFFLNKYFLKYQKFWNRIKKYGTFNRLALVSRIPRFILRPYVTGVEKRAFDNLLQSSLNLKYFFPVNSFKLNYNNNSSAAAVDFLKKAVARSFLLKSALSGSRFLKYLFLFSKKGNQRGLFNLLFKKFLMKRFTLFNNIIKYLYIQFGKGSIFTRSAVSLKSFSSNKIKLSIFCRRLYFGQVSSLSLFLKNITTFISPINIKFSKMFNSNLFLMSIRLLSELLSLFRVYVEVKAWKKSGRSIIVPAPIKSSSRRSFIFSHWFKESVLSKSNIEGGFGQKAFNEFVDLSKLEGDSLKKLNSLSKIIQTNKAFIRKSNMRIV